MRNVKGKKTFVKKFFDKYRDEIITNIISYKQKYGFVDDEGMLSVVNEVDDSIKLINHHLKFIDDYEDNSDIVK